MNDKPHPIMQIVKVRDILERPFKNGDFGLSPREIEALEWALKGKPRPVIAAEMNLTESAVGQYLFRGLGKLGISKSELGYWVIKQAKEALG